MHQIASRVLYMHAWNYRSAIWWDLNVLEATTKGEIFIFFHGISTLKISPSTSTTWYINYSNMSLFLRCEGTIYVDTSKISFKEKELEVEGSMGVTHNQSRPIVPADGQNKPNEP
jgi:hypothetical protein